MERDIAASFVSERGLGWAGADDADDAWAASAARRRRAARKRSPSEDAGGDEWDGLDEELLMLSGGGGGGVGMGLLVVGKRVLFKFTIGYVLSVFLLSHCHVVASSRRCGWFCSFYCRGSGVGGVGEACRIDSWGTRFEPSRPAHLCFLCLYLYPLHLLDVRDRVEVAVLVLVTEGVRVAAVVLVGDFVELREMEAVLLAVFVPLDDLVADLVGLAVTELVRVPVAARVVLGVLLLEGVGVLVPVLVAVVLLVAIDDGVPLRVPVRDGVAVRVLVFVSAPVLVMAEKGGGGGVVVRVRVGNGRRLQTTDTLGKALLAC